MTGWNLPPGVTDAMIDRAFGPAPPCGTCSHYHANKRFWGATGKKARNEYGLCAKHHQIVFASDDGCGDNDYDDREPDYDDRDEY